MPSPPSSPQVPKDRDARWPSILQHLQASAFNQTSAELQHLGRFLLHAALVGAVVGLAGSLFVWGLTRVEQGVLEQLAGYRPLRAAGEHLGMEVEVPAFRPWLLWIIPALGALGGGLLSILAPEIRGGGTDAIIHAFHHRAGVVRRRVPLLKALASILTLGSGGSGGREGPTMQIGGSLGSLVGRALQVTERERRILLVAGTAAGMAAVFRTPLGAALLAVEVLHRDDFESDAVVPAVLASVVSYSVFITFFGEATLFAHAPQYPFIPAHLPLYGLMAVLLSVVAVGFLGTMHAVQRITTRLPLPPWLKPAVGGLALGLLSTLILLMVGRQLGAGQGLGILGGGYGAAQVAITGAEWLPTGWRGVQLLLLLGVIKMVATSFTVGTGGSAGDFGPSLVIGGLFGGAFGHTAQLLTGSPLIDPGAFALVGMGTFYGGLAHVPIGALVMTCELAGSYDLLVPLMLAEGIAFVMLREHSLYKAQVNTRRDSPAHRNDLIFDVLRETRVSDVVVRDRVFVQFEPQTPAREVLQRMASSEWQDAFPVVGADGKIVGIISSDILRTFAKVPDLGVVTIAHDLMMAPTMIDESADLHSALATMLAQRVRELIVLDKTGTIVGFLDESEIAGVYNRVTEGG